MHITEHRRSRLAETPRDEKAAALRRHHALNPRAQTVSDSAFTSGNDFFDARDLVQVKYEMLRRVNEDGQPVTQAAADFGFSRPSFYQAQAVFEAEGLPGLLPQRPGPKRAHKLSEEVVDRLEQALKTDPWLNSAQLAQQLEEELGLRVHRRSVERALSRSLKKGDQRSRGRTPRRPAICPPPTGRGGRKPLGSCPPSRRVAWLCSWRQVFQI